MADPLTYREVTGLWTVRVPDGPDTDQYPDTVPLAGRVVFTPDYRKPLVYPGEHVIVEPISAVLVDGVLMAESLDGENMTLGPLFLPVTVDDRADQTWAWEMSFHDLRLGEYGETVDLPKVRFQIPEGAGPIDLSAVAPASSSGGVITLRGPRGYGITDITADSGVVTVEWEGGDDVTIPIPTAALATPTSDGLMPAADKAKLDGISLDTSVGTRVMVAGVMVYGSTGARDIRESLIRLDTIKAGGTAFLGREGNRVSLSLYDIDPYATGTVRITDTLPPGFRPNSRDAFTVSIISGSTLRAVVMPTGLYLYQVQENSNNKLRETLTWMTLDPWPTTLPGTPA